MPNGRGRCKYGCRHAVTCMPPGWERGTEATASAWEATGEPSGGGLSWGRRRAPDVLPSASAALPGLSLTLAMAHLEPEMGRLHGKGKMLSDGRRPRRFRERKIAPEHRHHRFDFEQRQVASGTHPRPASKRHEGLGRVAGAGLRGRRQPALGLKEVGVGKRGLV